MTNNKKFEELGLSKKVIEAINQKGFEEPTAIQIMTIPVMLRNDTNIIAKAQTGTGKTAAFGLPLIEMINVKKKEVQALILAPTRELAVQVSEEINSLKGDKMIKIVPIYGGQSIEQQLRKLKQGVQIVVGSPGRVIDHLKRRTLKLEKIKHLILDEADEMLNMGFIEDIEEIMKHTNPLKKTLLFSATMPRKIKNLAEKYMDGYELLEFKKENLITKLTKQLYFEVRIKDKFEALCRIIDIKENFYGLIFCRTKIDVDTVSNKLFEKGYKAGAIHGDISQAQRERILKKFKKKAINILVATDVAARGIDVNNLSYVINYSVPQDPESYVHRIGRTGRAGNEGEAITLITPSEHKQLMFIKKIAKTEIKKSKIPNVKEIIEIKKRNIKEKLLSIIGSKVNVEYNNWAKSLLLDNEPENLVAALLKYSFGNEISPDSYVSIVDVAKAKRDNRKEGGGRRGIYGGKKGGERLFVAIGKKDKITPKKLVELITKKVSIQSSQISDVAVLDNFSFITVPPNKADETISKFKMRGKRAVITKAKN